MTKCAVGTLVLDTATGRRGVFMEEFAGLAMLRPENGGVEWGARPEHVEPVESDEEASE